MSTRGHLRARLALGIAAGLVAACATTPHPVVPGVYHDPSGTEHLTVDWKSIALSIRIGDEGEPERFLTRIYELNVATDGTLSFRPIADTDYFRGVGRFDWRWDGERIARTDIRTGGVTLFSRQQP